MSGYDGGPFFSPDGKRIIWRHFSEKGDTADIFTMNLDGGDVRRLTDFKAMSWAPYYHPSGEYVAFASNKLGFSNFAVYLVDVLGTREPVRATFTDGFDGLPVFSPDGKQLLWTSNRTETGKSQLFIGRWDHEAALIALGKAKKIDVPQPDLPPAQKKLDQAKLSHEITEADIRAQVEFLASDEFEGRLTSSPGIRKAADYIVSQMKVQGLSPQTKRVHS